MGTEQPTSERPPVFFARVVRGGFEIEDDRGQEYAEGYIVDTSFQPSSITRTPNSASGLSSTVT